MQNSVEVVNRPRSLNHTFCGRLVRTTWVGQGCGRGFKAIQFTDPGLIRNREQQDLPSFFAVTNGEYSNARRLRCQGPAVCVRLCSICLLYTSPSPRDS